MLRPGLRPKEGQIMSIKAKVRKLLENYDQKGLTDLVLSDRRTISAINRLLFDHEELIRWRAVSAFGWVADEDPYLLDRIIGRLIYTMNDDSGSIGWMAPQALGEICAKDPDLVEDFFPIVLSSLENEVFTTGVIWAIGRVAPVRPDMVEDTGPALLPYLRHASAQIRGLTCLALSLVDPEAARQELPSLTTDTGEFNLYRSGELVSETVGHLAETALKAF